MSLLAWATVPLLALALQCHTLFGHICILHFSSAVIMSLEIHNAQHIRLKQCSQHWNNTPEKHTVHALNWYRPALDCTEPWCMHCTPNWSLFSRTIWPLSPVLSKGIWSADCWPLDPTGGWFSAENNRYQSWSWTLMTKLLIPSNTQQLLLNLFL